MGHSTRITLTRRAALLACVGLLTAVTVAAQEPAYQREARQLAAELMSPFCPGRTLADCPSAQAAELRDLIRQRLAAGATRRQVVDQLYEIYGDVILAAPPASGFGLLAWLVPGLFLAAGIAFLSVWLLRRRPTGAARVVPPSLESGAQRRLDSELADL